MQRTMDCLKGHPRLIATVTQKIPGHDKAWDSACADSAVSSLGIIMSLVLYGVRKADRSMVPALLYGTIGLVMLVRTQSRVRAV